MQIKKETSAQRLRKNEDYRLKELRDNAKRRKLKGYDLGRNKEIVKAHKKRRDKVGNIGRKKWTNSEIEFLQENKGGNYSMLAISLNRSLSSIEHKMIRLNLKKYHKYN